MKNKIAKIFFSKVVMSTNFFSFRQLHLEFEENHKSTNIRQNLTVKFQFYPYSGFENAMYSTTQHKIRVATL